ncbi:polysialyltransferase family glycosyltransferase [Thermodesulfobacteriota bacterium]
MFLIEDGFFHSLKTFSDPDASSDERSSLSYLFDDIAFYFDGARISRLEQKLNSDISLTGAERSRSFNLIKFITQNKLTKYNSQPILKVNYGRNKRKVLIIDQSYNDSSIIYGNSDADTFKKILECALDENPNNDILIKTHPDSRFKNKTYYSEVVENDRIKMITDPINPWCLFDIVDRVYVCSSQIGFEALMAGKHVVVFGCPFYSGWGLTDDRNPIKRRFAKRSLEELVYYALIWYTHYVDPLKGKVCDIEDTLIYLLNQRTDYFKINGLNNIS